MKRYFIAAIAAITILSLAGCSNSKTNTQSGDDKSQVKVTDLGGDMSEEEKEQAAFKDTEFECKADGITIKGSIRLPQGFEEGKKYPVAIMSHGILGDRDQGGLFSGLADSLESKDIVSVRFDFDGYGSSEGSLKDNSIKTEVNDLKGVVEYIKTLDYVDTDKINLVGFSMGGAATSIVAGEIPNEIHSVALWAPAAVLVDDSEAGRLMDAQVDVNNLPDEVPIMNGAFTFGKAFFADAIGLDIYGIAKEFKGPVLILQGDIDKVVAMSYSEKYDEVYENSELKVIKDGEHVFTGEALENVISLTTDFLAEQK